MLYSLRLVFYMVTLPTLQYIPNLYLVSCSILELSWLGFQLMVFALNFRQIKLIRSLVDIIQSGTLLVFLATTTFYRMGIAGGDMSTGVQRVLVYALLGCLFLEFLQFIGEVLFECISKFLLFFNIIKPEVKDNLDVYYRVEEDPYHNKNSGMKWKVKQDGKWVSIKSVNQMEGLPGLTPKNSHKTRITKEKAKYGKLNQRKVIMGERTPSQVYI